MKYSLYVSRFQNLNETYIQTVKILFEVDNILLSTEQQKKHFFIFILDLTSIYIFNFFKNFTNISH